MPEKGFGLVLKKNIINFTNVYKFCPFTAIRGSMGYNLQAIVILNNMEAKLVFQYYSCVFMYFWWIRTVVNILNDGMCALSNTIIGVHPPAWLAAVAYSCEARTLTARPLLSQSTSFYRSIKVGGTDHKISVTIKRAMTTLKNPTKSTIKIK